MTHKLKAAVGALALLLIAACATTSDGDTPRQGYFFVGGRYVDSKAGPLMERQMYVEYHLPVVQKHPYPIVMIHGAAQTGTNFTGTPDGRKGWAQFFVERGYAVYVVDQPARGRSAYLDSLGGNVRFSSAQLEQRFTAHEKFNLWPQAKLHTQWPGTGQRGDPTFDQFYASQVQYIGSGAVTQELNRDAGAALLDKIGPAIVMGQQIVVENRPGASSLVGTQLAAKAPADGYTFLAIANTFAMVPSILTNPGYDPLKDFSAITLTCLVPQVLVVNPALPVKTVRELIALAKARPGELTYATSGPGGTGHMATELFSRQVGVKMLHVPYKGNSQALIDVIGGQVMTRNSTSAARPGATP